MNLEPNDVAMSPAGCSLEHVLVAEDDPIYRRVLEQSLGRWGYEVVVATDGQHAWQILQQESAPNLLILDWIMPGLEGPELCRRVRAQQRSRYAYVVLVTSKDAKEDVIQGLDAGADDYLVKPFSIAELRARVNVGKRILTLQDELIRAREELRFGATHDWLTGVWNRGSAFSFLSRELDRAARLHSHMGVLMVDIDHFKRVNDTYGHPFGDLVLREVAQRIGQCVRAYDLVARYGGEEFTVMFSDCEPSEILRGAERIRSAVSDAPISGARGEITVTVSVGAAVSSCDTHSPEVLLARADEALYRAKQNGRNRVEASWDTQTISFATNGLTANKRRP